jgi:hypothetical protein
MLSSRFFFVFFGANPIHTIRGVLPDQQPTGLKMLLVDQSIEVQKPSLFTIHWVILPSPVRF